MHIFQLCENDILICKSAWIYHFLFLLFSFMNKLILFIFYDEFWLWKLTNKQSNANRFFFPFLNLEFVQSCAVVMGHRHLMNSSFQMSQTTQDHYGSHGTAEQFHFRIGIGELNYVIWLCRQVTVFLKVYTMVCYAVNI